MSIGDLTSALGAPTGGAVIAIALYRSLVSAEKVAKKDALADIAHFLQKDFGFARLNPNRAFYNLFRATFGSEHLSQKCFIRSSMATLLFVFSMSIFYWMRSGVSPIDTSEDLENSIIARVLMYCLMAIIPDYIALAKTRILLFICSNTRVITITALLLVLDVLLSVLISFIVNYWWTTVFVGVSFSLDPSMLAEEYKLLQINIMRFVSMKGAFPDAAIFFFLTLFTSIWT